MKFKIKLSLFTSILMICILILVNCITYFLFIKISTENEKELLISKVDNMVENVNPNILLTQHSENALQSFLPDNSMIRIVDKDGNVINQLADDQDVPNIKQKFTKVSGSDLYSFNGHKILFVRSPIKLEGTVIGTAEIGEKIVSLEENIKTLIYLLLFSSLGAVFITIVCSLILSKMMLRPLTSMIKTMKEIDRQLTFKKIKVENYPKDEIYELITTFNHMIERLEINFLRQKQFVSDASHELKTPLTIIQTYTDMLMRWGMKDEEVQKEAILSIHETALHMKNLTQQMLDLASSEKDTNLTLTEVDLVGLSENVGEMLRKIYNQLIKITASSNSIFIMGDFLKIKQLLLILIDNALKYSNEAVEIHINEDSEHATIQIKDYGIGISKGDIDHIFERFYRVEKSRARKTGGTGLGLSIAKLIVIQHKGMINVLSKEGIGTEVIVKFPKKIK